VANKDSQWEDINMIVNNIFLRYVNIHNQMHGDML